MTISDASHAEAQHYIEGWEIDFSHTLDNQNNNFWWVIIEVDPAYIDASETSKTELKTSMQDHVVNSKYWAGSSVVSFTSSSMTVKIPKGGTYQTAEGLSNLDYLKLLKSDFSDIFKTFLKIRRYHFSEADVDNVIAQGGEITITKAQALNNIIDRLTE